MNSVGASRKFSGQMVWITRGAEAYEGDRRERSKVIVVGVL